MPTIHTVIHNHSHGVHTTANRETAIHRPSFTEVSAVNDQVQNDHSQPIHSHSHTIHGHLARVMNSSPEGGFITACPRARLTGVDVARAGQILTILERIKFRVPCTEAIQAVREALAGDHDPQSVLNEILGVVAECRGERVLRGQELELSLIHI